MEGPEKDLEQFQLKSSLPPPRFDFTDRQDLEIYSPVVVVVIVGGLALLAFQLLLPLLAPLLSGLTSTSLERNLVPLLPPLSMPGLPAVAVTTSREGRRRLENHPRCGITTGGQVFLKFALRQPIHKFVSRRNVGGIVRSDLNQYCMAKPLQTLSVSAIASPRGATHPAGPL